MNHLSKLLAQGAQLQQQGRLQEAQSIYQHILQQSPEHSEALHLLGTLAYQVGQYPQAIQLITRAITFEARPQYLNNLGNVYKTSGFLEQAIECYQKALQIAPKYAGAHNNLGIVYQRQGHLQLAIKHFQEAISQEQTKAEWFSNLATALMESGQVTQAINFYKEALKVLPDYAPLHSNLGNAYERRGDFSKAIVHYQQSLKLNPDLFWVHSNLLFCLRAQPQLTATQRFEHFLMWNKQHAQPISSTQEPLSFEAPPDKPVLRIGYVSGDFRNHSASSTIGLLLANHKHQSFEVYAYVEVTHEDNTTKELKQMVDYWRITIGKSNQEVAKIIEKDKIDILIDLAGHTANHRLLTFAYRPAPIQVTGLGFGDTTGMQAIDYRFSDRWISEPVTCQFNSEKVIYLDSLMRWKPPEWHLPNSPLPMLKNGYLTLGCGNSLFKLNSEVISLWADVLKALPEAKLYLKKPEFNDPQTCESYLKKFQQLGIASNQVQLFGRTSQQEHFAFYSQLDIALDPFPYNGGITSCEVLWMGVPVLTLKTGIQSSVSILANLGLEEWIADTKVQFIEKVLSMASRPDDLMQLREQLRTKLLSSAICDGAGFTRQIEDAYRMMWRLYHQVN